MLRAGAAAPARIGGSRGARARVTSGCAGLGGSAGVSCRTGWPPSIPSPSSASTPPFNALPAALFDAAARTLEIGYYPAGALAGPRRRRAAAAPLRHPQGLGPAGARRADAAGAGGGRDLRLHLAPHRQGHARRAGGGRPARLPAAGGALPGAALRRAVRRPLRGRALAAAQEQPGALAGHHLQGRPAARGARAAAPPGRLGGGRRHGAARRPASCASRRSPRCWSAATPPASSPTATSATACWPRGSGRRPGSTAILSRPLRTVEATIADLGRLDHAARHREPPPAHPARRGDRRRAHLHRPPQGPRSRAGGGAAPRGADGRPGAGCPATPTR